MTGAAKRWIAVAGAALVLTGSAAGAPHALRRMHAFRVRHIEVRGTVYLEPATALDASDIPATATVFDDFTPWRTALRTHALVTNVRITRRLPDTIVLDITESEPVAFVRTPELRPADATGRILPIAPGAPGLDLPVLALRVTTDTAGRIREAAAVSMLATVGQLRTRRPALLAWVSEVRPLASDGLRLVLRWPAGAEILVPAQLVEAKLEELDLVLSDLAAARDAARADTTTRTELARVQRIDARFRDQIVVSLAGGTPSRNLPREDR
ncbi:MAG: cell division protein FtsQ/DivIB [Longimicrobiales bacterium]